MEMAGGPEVRQRRDRRCPAPPLGSPPGPPSGEVAPRAASPSTSGSTDGALMVGVMLTLRPCGEREKGAADDEVLRRRDEVLAPDHPPRDPPTPSVDSYVSYGLLS